MKVLTQDGFKDFEGFLDQGTPDTLYNLHFFDNESTISCTADHRFLLQDKKRFKEAKDLEVGDVLFPDRKIASIIKNTNVENERVYDLENVSDTHSYYTNGVISHNCSLIYLDELAFINNAEEFYKSTYPTIVSGKNTKIIATSTANGIGNLFHRLWTGAVTGTNEYAPFRVDWWSVPGRDEEWKKTTIANTSQQQFDQEFGNCLKSNSQITIRINNLIAVITIGNLYECIQRGTTSGLPLDEEIRLSAIRWYYDREAFETETDGS